MSEQTKNIKQIAAMTLAAGLIAIPAVAFGQADGTPGNPPGTAASRAVDRATGQPSIPDGAPGNPPGTAVGRAIDRLTGQPTNRDGTGNNPPGTAVDRAAGRAAQGVSQGVAGATGAATTAAAGVHLPPEQSRASKLIGSRLYNDRAENIGEIEEVVLNAPGPMAVVQIGGFLGMGGRQVAVPLSELRWSGENNRLTLPGATQDALRARPEFHYDSLRRG
jgi:hypothetical protein